MPWCWEFSSRSNSDDGGGAYQLHGGALKVSDNTDDVAKGRPASFVTEAGSGQVLVSFRRVKR